MLSPARLPATFRSVLTLVFLALVLLVLRCSLPSVCLVPHARRALILRALLVLVSRGCYVLVEDVVVGLNERPTIDSLTVLAESPFPVWIGVDCIRSFDTPLRAPLHLFPCLFNVGVELVEVEERPVALPRAPALSSLCL